MDKKYYYEVHIFLGQADGYSCFFESDKQLSDKEAILKEALIVIPELNDDSAMCDYAKEITHEEYLEATK